MKNKTPALLTIVALGALSGCKSKNPSNADVRSLDNFSSTALDRQNFCRSAQAYKGGGTPDLAWLDTLPMASHLETDATVEAGEASGLLVDAKVALSALPEAMQADLVRRKVRVVLTKDVAGACVNATMAYELDGCIRRIQGKETVYQRASPDAISHGLLKATARVFLERNGKLWRDVVAISYVYDRAGSSAFSDDTLERYLTKQVADGLVAKARSGQLVDAPLVAGWVPFANRIVAETFDSYFCNAWAPYDEQKAKAAANGDQSAALAFLASTKNTRRILNDFFPLTSRAIAPFLKVWTQGNEGLALQGVDEEAPEQIAVAPQPVVDTTETFAIPTGDFAVNDADAGSATGWPAETPTELPATMTASEGSCDAQGLGLQGLCRNIFDAATFGIFRPQAPIPPRPGSSNAIEAVLPANSGLPPVWTAMTANTPAAPITNADLYANPQADSAYGSTLPPPVFVPSGSGVGSINNNASVQGPWGDQIVNPDDLSQEDIDGFMAEARAQGLISTTAGVATSGARAFRSTITPAFSSTNPQLARQFGTTPSQFQAGTGVYGQSQDQAFQRMQYLQESLQRVPYNQRRSSRANNTPHLGP